MFHYLSTKFKAILNKRKSINLIITRKINWDAFGISTSIICAIHCAILPLILTSLPLFGVNIIENQGFELIMIGLAFLIGIISLLHGWKKHHHRLTPILIFSIGMICLLAKQIWHNYHLLFLMPAILLIIGAHYFNYRLCNKAKHCHSTDCDHS